MYHISDLYDGLIQNPVPTDCGVICERIDPKIALINRQLMETGSIYSFTLLLTGRIVLRCSDRQVTLEKNDLFIMTPGIEIYTLEVSPDYSALCIMAEEKITYDIPYARNIVCASYFPVIAGCGNRLSLTQEDAGILAGRMNDMANYTYGRHVFKKECIYSLYSLFMLDLLNIENELNKVTDCNDPAFDLFFRFLKLLTEHFKDHHNLSFYADRLSVTSIYLSRVVKKLSGQTVKNHIDRLLAMEGAYLLLNTDYSVTRIADELNFSNPVGFCKFFSRQKGMSPTEYRTSRTDTPMAFRPQLRMDEMPDEIRRNVADGSTVDIMINNSKNHQ